MDVVEELDPMSLSDRAVNERGIAEAYERARTLEDLDVFDPNGMRVGRITRCFANVDEKRIHSCEIRLDKTLKRELSYGGDTVRVRHDWLTDASAEGVRLTHGAAQVLGGTLAAGAEDAEGSDTFPRKTR